MAKSFLAAVILGFCACGGGVEPAGLGGNQQPLQACPQACPSACPSGTVCLTDGDGCVGCQPMPVAGAPECRVDADCSGPLPRICRVCDDGRDACAHWTCVNGVCTATTCG